MGDCATHLGQQRILADGRQVTIRPVEHGDEAAERGFFGRLSSESMRLRFLKFVSALIADDWHKSGIAGLLMDALIRYARASGFETMEGMVLRDNRTMVRFVRALGFEVAPIAGEPTLLRVARTL